MQRILGLDPGLQTIGYGCIESNGKNHRLVGGDVIKTDSKDDLSQRLKIIYERFQELLNEFEPDSVSMERLFFFRNVTSAIRVAQAQGVLILVCASKPEMPIVEYTPLQIKLALTGYGRATKQQVQVTVQELLKLSEKPKPNDYADALGAALTLALATKAASKTS